MKIYNRLGGIEMAETDALSACRNYPQEWTREPWIRPDGRPYTDIPQDWEIMGVLARIDLARLTLPDLCRGSDLETAEQADQAISEYLAGTQHPGHGEKT